MMAILSTATDTSTGSAGSPVGGIVVFAVISVLLWLGLSGTWPRPSGPKLAARNA